MVEVHCILNIFVASSAYECWDVLYLKQIYSIIIWIYVYIYIIKPKSIKNRRSLPKSSVFLELLHHIFGLLRRACWDQSWQDSEAHDSFAGVMKKYQPKQYTVTGEVLQVYHTFALFDSPKIGNLMIPVLDGSNWAWWSWYFWWCPLWARRQIVSNFINFCPWPLVQQLDRHVLLGWHENLTPIQGDSKAKTLACFGLQDLDSSRNYTKLSGKIVGKIIVSKCKHTKTLDLNPTQHATVANEGLVWDYLQKNVIILVVTVTGRGAYQDKHA